MHSFMRWLSCDERIRACGRKHAIKDGAADGDLCLLRCEGSCPQSMSDQRPLAEASCSLPFCIRLKAGCRL